MPKIYLGLGTNQGNRLANLIDAQNRISKEIGEIILKSSVYENPPVGFESDINFYNMVLQINSELSVVELFLKLKEIEKLMGRKKNNPQVYESRIIDIDILDFDGEVIETSNLVIPHLKMTERDFVMIPLFEISPNWVHPKSLTPIQRIISEKMEKNNILKRIKTNV